MRLGVLIGVVVTALFAAIATTTVVVKVVTDQQAAQAQAYGNVSCDAAIGPTNPGQAQTAQGQAANLGPDSKQIVSAIVSIGKQRGLSPRAWQIAIQAGMTESGLRNLGYGDRDSLGIFQMRPSMGWGTVAELQDIAYQINKFYDVLLSVPNWDQQRPGASAQAVERSAFPERYHRWEPMAAFLVENVGQVSEVSTCGQSVGLVLPPNQAASAAIAFALEEQGKPYVWGATGPSSYDCSGLTQDAWKAAGISLPRTTWDQVKVGTKVSKSQLQPGDLVFFYDDISHVGIYSGGGKMIHAPKPGASVRYESIDYMPFHSAVRPG